MANTNGTGRVVLHAPCFADAQGLARDLLFTLDRFIRAPQGNPETLQLFDLWMAAVPELLERDDLTERERELIELVDCAAEAFLSPLPPIH